jgi:hypothetical protein
MKSRLGSKRCYGIGRGAAVGCGLGVGLSRLLGPGVGVCVPMGVKVTVGVALGVPLICKARYSGTRSVHRLRRT